jgi:sulfatase modifying factor 1
MKTRCVFVALIVTFISVASAHAVEIETVPIGNPGNPADTRYDATGFGSVAYDYRIGTTEVTNAQYVEFLNSVAATDTFGLYNINMGSGTWGGIVRSGVDGAYRYAVKPDAVGQGPGGSDYTYAKKPVVLVSLFDAIRFANWLHHGQGGPETTEDGAYTLLGGTPTPSNWQTITRNPGARWWLPSEDEWYKAAYYDLVSEVYYDYPIGTNTVPNNNLPSNDTGNSANCWDGDYTTGNASYPLTDAGAYTQSGSPYGTFDQGGSVWEWNETLVSSSYRIVRGGWWNGNSNGLRASVRDGGNPTVESVDLGFRVASIPEPSALLLLALGGLMPLWRYYFNAATRRGWS